MILLIILHLFNLLLLLLLLLPLSCYSVKCTHTINIITNTKYLLMNYFNFNSILFVKKKYDFDLLSI